MLKCMLTAAIVTCAALDVVATQAREGSPIVVIGNTSPTPESLTVKAETKITFKNEAISNGADDGFHSVVAADGTFNSQRIGPGKTYSRVFATPGEYRYFDGVSPYLEGHIVVVP